MGNELLPCPFCGGEPHIERLGNARFSTIVSCLDCGVTHECGDTGSSVGNGWNRRAPLASYDKLAASHAELLVRVGELEAAQACVYDGHAVLVSLSESAAKRTTAENVSDVLDALAKVQKTVIALTRAKEIA